VPQRAVAPGPAGVTLSAWADRAGPGDAWLGPLSPAPRSSPSPDAVQRIRRRRAGQPQFPRRPRPRLAARSGARARS
jgi:hypothetical protein